MQRWVADNRTPASLLPKPRVATKADLARPNTHEPETLRHSGGPATHCYLCCEEWRDHLTKEEEEEMEGLERGFISSRLCERVRSVIQSYVIV